MAKRQTIVLIPALLCDSRLYDGVKAALCDDFNVQIADTSHDETVDAMAARLLDAAPGRFAIAGNSMGGYVALAVLAMAPDRISHLMLMGTNAAADTPEARQKRAQAVRLAEGGKFPAFVDGYVDGALNPDTADEFGPILRAMARGLGPGVLIRQQKAIMGRPNRMALLAGTRQPALVLYGEADALSPLSAHEAMAKALQNGSLEVIEGAGHLIPLEKPEIVAASIRRLLAL